MKRPGATEAPDGAGLRLLILGMGISIASDDAIGLVIAERIRARAAGAAGVEVRTTERDGLAVLDLMEGFDRAIVVDSIKTGRHEPGEILRFSPEEFDFSPRSAAVHDVSFFQAVELGRRLGLKMPEKMDIVAVEIVDNINVSEKISPDVLAAVEPAVKMVEELASAESS